MTNDDDHQISGEVVGTMVVQLFSAIRALVGDFQKGAEHAAFAACRAAAEKAEPERFARASKLLRGRDLGCARFHVAHAKILARLHMSCRNFSHVLTAQLPCGVEVQGSTFWISDSTGKPRAPSRLTTRLRSHAGAWSL